MQQYTTQKRHTIAQYNLNAEQFSDPNVGASTCPNANDIVNKAAYCPRLYSLLLLTQKVLTKGNISISPAVRMIIASSATVRPANGKI